jgi:uncharacterized protein
MSDSAVLIFTKSPVPGQVKTRLSPALGEEGAARLYTTLLRREVAWIAQQTSYAMELWATPDTGHPVLRELSQCHRLPILQQQGNDLGERMGHAVREALTRFKRVVLLGVDCPALTPGDLHRAFDWLAQGADAVLGPADDGGYVLLGLRQSHPALFQGHAWGSESVAATTREALRRIGWQWRELPPLWDLDRPEDLAKYRRLERGVAVAGEEGVSG